jgi:hypothetical protein
VAVAAAAALVEGCCSSSVRVTRAQVLLSEGKNFDYQEADIGNIIYFLI